MKETQYYKNEFVRGMDLAFTDGRELVAKNPLKSIYKIIEPGSHTFLRTQALFELIRKAIPEQVWERAGSENFFRDYSAFPIDPNKYSISHRVGSGAQCDCFLLENKEDAEKEAKSLVLKVFQKSGLTLAELEKKAQQVKGDYSTLKQWYMDMPGLIPEQSQVIMTRFQKPHNKPMLVVLQQFLGNRVQDVALDFTDEVWKGVCKKHPVLSTQLQQFTDITEDNAKNYGKVPDLLGRNNLSVAWLSGKPNLFFLDPDGIDEFKHMTPKVLRKVTDRMALLRHRASF